MNKATKLTQASAHKICARFNATLHCADGEFTVRNKTSGETYVADCLENADRASRVLWKRSAHAKI